ncbi:hypothetical protein BCEP4_1950006 [Burkholderia cepacia]|nr:hypothetical protein BCEP4_1950006 [Burkholderia cepacia]
MQFHCELIELVWLVSFSSESFSGEANQSNSLDCNLKLRPGLRGVMMVVR